VKREKKKAKAKAQAKDGYADIKYQNQCPPNNLSLSLSLRL
jgi:hypothetical protein